MKKIFRIVIIVFPIILIIFMYSYPIILPFPVIPTNEEIVFWDEGRIGFISFDGHDLEYRYIKPSIATTNLDLFRYFSLGDGITWGLNGDELVAGFNQYNPSVQEPVIIENSGRIRSCLSTISMNSIGRSRSIGDNRIITAVAYENEINRLVILNLQSCQIESVLYETSGSISEGVQSPEGWLAVWVNSSSFSGIRIVSPSGIEAEEIPGGSYPYYSQGWNSIAYVGSDGIYSYDLSTLVVSFLIPGSHIRCPSVSPNGEYIVYEANSGISIFSLHTGETEQIIDHGNCPDWRP